MRHLVAAILFVAMIVVQATVSPRIAIWGVAPDLMVVLVVELAFRLPRPENLVWPWAAGLASDLRGDGPAGVLAFTYALTALAIDRMREFFFVESLFVRPAAVAVADLLHHAAIAISQIIRGQGPSFMLFCKETLVGMLYTTALSVALLPLMAAALRRVIPRERRG